MEATKKAYLEELGVNLEETLPRFLDSEDFYLRLLTKLVNGTYMQDVEEALAREDYETAFRAIHSLKGASANLGLNGLFEETQPLTEELRNPPYNRKDIEKYLSRVKKTFDDDVAVLKKVIA